MELILTIKVEVYKSEGEKYFLTEILGHGTRHQFSILEAKHLNDSPIQ